MNFVGVTTTGNACKHAYALELSSMKLEIFKFYMSCSSGKQGDVICIESKTENIVVLWSKCVSKQSVIYASLSSCVS